MSDKMINCWELKNCGREKEGARTSELGECIAAKENLGHSCWAIAGTLCGGKVQGTFAEKERDCVKCIVYIKYNRLNGSEGEEVLQGFPEEDIKYKTVLLDHFNKK